MKQKSIVPAYLTVDNELLLSGKLGDNPGTKEISMLGIEVGGHYIATDKSGFVYALELGPKSGPGRKVTSFGQGTFVRDGATRQVQFVAMSAEVEDDEMIFKPKGGRGTERLANPDLHPIVVDPLKIAAKLGAEDAETRSLFLCKVDNDRLVLTSNQRLHADSTPIDLADVVLKSAGGSRHFVRIKADGVTYVGEVEGGLGNVIGRVATLNRSGDVAGSCWQKLYSSVRAERTAETRVA